MRTFERRPHVSYVPWLVLLFVAVGASLQAAGDLEITSRDLPWAVVDRPYAQPPIEVLDGGRCPVGGLGFAMISGSLPPGIRLSHAGYLTGAASKAGSYWFAV